jgi:hypothetical protein
MRNAIMFALVAALAAAPAVAQNDATNDVIDANATTMAAPADNGAVAATDVNGAPVEPVATETTEPAPAPVPAPARKSSGGFPWGVVGLVGLVGLMGRKRRE